MEHLSKIYDNDSLNLVIEQQVLGLLKRKIESLPKIADDFSEIRKAVWLASILAESDDEKHLKKVQDLAILLFLNNPDEIEILKIAYVLFSRIGNLAATGHLKPLISFYQKNETFGEDIILQQELITKRTENSILIDEKPYLLTDFQKNLFTNIHEQKYISISAPTSSGKSFILKKYIETELKIKEKYCVFYIVPSRALINQVSEELRIDLQNITIKNAFIEDEKDHEEKLIYVITPERAVKIINSEHGLILPDLIFIDEIQNVENEDGRGNLFEYVYEELSKVPEHTKIITAGPFISNSNEIFRELFDKESKVVNTDLSPVFQLRTIIKLEENSISLTLFAGNKVFHQIKEVIKIPKIEKTFNTNIGNGLAQIVAALSHKNDSNLIYSSRGDYAESWALKFAESVALDGDLEDELKDLIKYVRTDIHEEYFLLKCLKKRVAFHHSSLSEFVRKEIETLFEQGIITTLFCTSTLLEGVNLPADNLFVIKPEKNMEQLSDFEFGNLIGRAGRLKNTLYGTIFCVSKKNNVEWAENYYQADYLKEVRTSSSRALPEISTDELTKTSLEIESSKIRNLITSLRNKALRDDESIEKFFAKHKLAATVKSDMIRSVRSSVENVTIPYNVVKRNPTIDPILQDKLYKIVVQDLQSWVIHPNSNFNAPYRREIANNIEYSNQSFFWQFDSIISRLNEIFAMSKEIWVNDHISIASSGICINAMNWMQGNSIGDLISNRIKFYSEDERVKPENRIDASNPEHINRMIKEAIKINLKVVTFSLLKYLKLLVDILDEVLDENQKERYKMTLALPIQVELGSQEPIVLSLITQGIPRTVALKLFEIYKKTDEYKNEIKIFEWMRRQEIIAGLEPIYNKFLAKNNFLKQPNFL